MGSHSTTAADIDALCTSRGVRFTKQRREIFEVLQAVGQPISAYDLLARLEAHFERKLAPLTVYRSLDFLVEQGFAHKIESSHSYVVCDHPHETHHSIHLICSECGAGEELPIGDIQAQLDALAQRSQFTPQRHIVELEGLCKGCSA